MNFKNKLLGVALGTALASLTTGPAMAASHSDAPLIKQDPQANLTDVYAFVGAHYNDPSQQVLNVVVSVRPFSEPGDGVIYDRFADDALYSVHITDPSSGETELRYDFRFSSVTSGLKNDGTILSYGLGNESGPIRDVGDARQNYTQSYSVTKRAGGNRQVIASGLLTPPPNVGANTTPEYNDLEGVAASGATQLNELDRYTRQTLYTVPTGEALFAGPREDGFYADIPAIFDLLDDRILDNDGDLNEALGQDGGGVDGFKGFNVLSYAIQIPLEQLSPSPFTAVFADLGNTENPLPSAAQAIGVGVYASVSRKRIRLLRSKRGPINAGPWVQVNRMGNPLFNEALVALADKDNYNRSSPVNDVADFSTYAENPELATLINTVFGANLADSGRSDLAAVFAPDVIRVDTTTGPVRLAGQPGFSRFGFAGNDTVTAGDGRIISGGWPNGRRFGDDVIDIALTAVASGPTYDALIAVGDNIEANDQVYHQVFPYAATPHAGPTNQKDSN